MASMSRTVPNGSVQGTATRHIPKPLATTCGRTPRSQGFEGRSCWVFMVTPFAARGREEGESTVRSADGNPAGQKKVPRV